MSPTLVTLGRMNFHLFPTCPPHLSRTLGALGRISLHLPMVNPNIRQVNKIIDFAMPRCFDVTAGRVDRS